MPDAKMTEGERILREWDESYEFNSQLARLDGIRVLRLKQRIDAALAAKDAEIERITNERDQLIQHAEVDPYVITDDGIVVCHACGAPKEPTNDHHT